jgi:hypothetical protein
VESGEWRLLNNSNIQKYGNLKKSKKKIGLFFDNSTRNYIGPL